MFKVSAGESIESLLSIIDVLCGEELRFDGLEAVALEPSLLIKLPIKV
jgi:hypothetical protein